MQRELQTLRNKKRASFVKWLRPAAGRYLTLTVFYIEKHLQAVQCGGHGPCSRFQLPIGEELGKLEYGAGVGRAEVVALSENVAHHQRAKHDLRLRVAPVAEEHVGECIRDGASRKIDDISRAQKAIAANVWSVVELCREADTGACAETVRMAATTNNAIEAAQTAVNFLLFPALLKVVPPTAFADSRELLPLAFFVD